MGKRNGECRFRRRVFSDFSEVKYHVRDVTLGDVVFNGGVSDFAELGGVAEMSVPT